MELPRERVSSTPSPRYVPRAVAGTGGYRYRSNTWLIGWWHRIKMTVRELVIPFQRNKRSKSVTTAGRPAGRPLILTFLRYIEVDSLRASRSARNNVNKMLHVVLGRYGVKRYIKIVFNTSNMHSAHRPWPSPPSQKSSFLTRDHILRYSANSLQIFKYIAM